MSEEQIAEIAAGLTKAQRRGLNEAWRSPAGVLQVGSDCEGHHLHALEEAGLVDHSLALTPLGLRIRLHLLQDTRP